MSQMFGLFLLVCFTGGECKYVPQGWVYPDEENCVADMADQRLPSPKYECLPVDGILRPAE